MLLYRSGFFGLVFSINLAVSNQIDRMDSGSVREIFCVVVKGVMTVFNKVLPGAGGWVEGGLMAEGFTPVSMMALPSTAISDISSKEACERHLTQLPGESIPHSTSGEGMS